MEVTKLTISPETLSNTLLTTKKKRQLRRENILAYIRSKPIGEPIRISELAVAAGYTANGNTLIHSLIKTMTKEKLITFEKIN